MKARVIRLAVSIVYLCTSLTLAAGPLGPPHATFGDKKLGIGASFGFQTMDLEAKGTYFEQITADVLKDTPNTLKIKDLESTSAFLQIGWGLTPNWDVYGCIGTSNAKGDTTVHSPSQPNTYGFGNGETFGFSNNHDLAWGVGTRFTLRKTQNVDWGGVFQMTWLNPKVGTSQWTSINDSTYRIEGNWNLDYWEITAAFGPTVYYENITFYGGPFLQIVKGDMTLDGAYVYQNGSNTGTASASQDLKEESMIGGYAGAQFDVTERLLMYVDGQITSNAWGIGIGALLRH